MKVKVMLCFTLLCGILIIVSSNNHSIMEVTDRIFCMRISKVGSIIN
ncbi:hypothetical protein ACFSCX_06670 [Bacillus salitolerans]|uniref:Uncharacterized protein n=1 Tax=Bacillus salitolerans TaxID=1437434 RepID=A0ABW4LM34_9BACI